MPIELPPMQEGEDITYIACGVKYSAIITSYNKIYVTNATRTNTNSAKLFRQKEETFDQINTETNFKSKTKKNFKNRNKKSKTLVEDCAWDEIGRSIVKKFDNAEVESISLGPHWFTCLCKR